jgi:hypothetical protein
MAAGSRTTLTPSSIPHRIELATIRLDEDTGRIFSSGEDCKAKPCHVNYSEYFWGWITEVEVDIE